MAYLQGFQSLEQRDSQDMIVAEGVVSKKSPFATADNNGIYDVIAEDLRVLNEELKNVKTNNDLIAIRDEVKKMYGDMTTNESFGAVAATAQAKVAKEQAEIAAAKAKEAMETLSKITAEKLTVNDNIADVKRTVTDVKEYLSKVEQVQNAIAGNLKRTSEQAEAATKASEEANKAKIWAQYEGSPDNAADKESLTGKSMSSRGWAIRSKNEATASATSAAGAKTSETNAKASATAASLSEGKAKTSENQARISEQNADQSEANAKTYAENAKASADEANSRVGQALIYRNISETWAEGSPAIETVKTKDKNGKEVTQTIVHKSAKKWAEDAKASAASAKANEDKVQGYIDTMEQNATLSTTNATNAKLSEDNAKTHADNAKASSDSANTAMNTAKTNAENSKADALVAKKWAALDSSPDGAVDNDSPSGFTQSAKTWAMNAKTSASNASTSASNAKTYTANIKSALDTCTAIESRAKTLQAEIEKMKNDTQAFLTEARTIRESLSNAVTYKGSKATYAQLPTTGNRIGDMWNVEQADASHSIKAGDNVVWNGTAWDNMGGFIDTSTLAKVNSDVTFKTVKATTFTGALAGNANTATTATKANQLTTARTVDGVNFNGTGNVTHYGTCSTAAATVEKAVACAGYVLATGSTIKVKFTVTNSAANPTLNVQSTGAKPIFYRGAAIGAGYLAANRTYEFIFNGTQYELLGDINTDTNNAMAQNISTGNATYPVLLCPTANATANQGNKAGIFGAGVKVNPSTSEVIAGKFTGALNGNANTATKATQDGNGNNIANTYATKAQLNDYATTAALGDYAQKSALPNMDNYVEKAKAMGSFDGVPIGAIILAPEGNCPAGYIDITNDWKFTSSHNTLITKLKARGIQCKVGDSFPGFGKVSWANIYMKYR